MTKPYMCWAALLISLVAFGMSLAAFSIALVALEVIHVSAH